MTEFMTIAFPLLARSPNQRRRVARIALFAIVGSSVVMSSAAPAHAHRVGIATTSCAGCHGSPGTASLSLSGQPTALAAGDQLTVTVTIQRSANTGGTTNSGGLYVAPPTLGQLVALPGEGLMLANGDSLVHSTPKAAQGGVVTFRFAWRAPTQPGAVRFQVYGLAANGDGTPTGDVTGAGQFDAAFGCTLQEFFPDADGDGFGNSAFMTAPGCSGQPLAGYAAQGGDCSDGDPGVHPGAKEVCNGKDDNCDGQTDENAPFVQMWPDDDGDGYYQKQIGTPIMGCGGVPGYAALGGDCAPKDPKIHPNAIEICNLIDDNCNGFIDEGVRPTCGVGFCRRESQTCVVTDCVPGVPSPEKCNLLDEDCDGIVDDGDTCGAGQACVVGQCLPASSDAPGTTGTGRTGAGLAQGGTGGAVGPDAAGGHSPAPGTGGVIESRPSETRRAPSSGCGLGRDFRDGSGWSALILACAALARSARRRGAKPAQRGRPPT
jgi:hypothetical protein